MYFPQRILLLSLFFCSVAGCTPDSAQPTTRMIKVNDGPGRDTAKAKVLNTQAANYIAESNFSDAESRLKEAIAIDPDFGPAHNNLGVVYFSQSKSNQSKMYAAARQFLLAAALMPRDAEPRNGLGLVFESSNRFDDAIAYYDRARALDPSNPIYLGNSARARVRRGDRSDEVITMLTRLIAIDARPDWHQWEQDTLTHLSRPARTEP